MALAKYEASFRRIYRTYRVRAKKNKIPFLLGPSTFREIAEQNCTYCEAEPTISPWHIKAFNGAWRFNGLDRIDNTKGYEYGNVQPCCSLCNRIKSDMSESRFLSHVTRIVRVSLRKGSIKED